MVLCKPSVTFIHCLSSENKPRKSQSCSELWFNKLIRQFITITPTSWLIETPTTTALSKKRYLNLF